MKSYLLLIAAAFAVTTANAQQVKVGEVSMAKKYNAVATTAQRSQLMLGQTAPATKGQMRRAEGTALNPTAYAKRPYGSMFLGWADNAYSFNGSFLVVPGMANVTFTNASTDPSATTWWINGTNANSYADASGNYSSRYRPVDALGYGYYGPILVNGTDTSTVASSIAVFDVESKTGRTWSDGTWAAMGMSPAQFNSVYYGSSGPTPWFGDETQVIDYSDYGYSDSTWVQTAFYQIYEKPVGSFSLSGVSMFLWCNGADFKTNAADMHIYVYNVVDTTINGRTYTNQLGNNLLGTLSFVPDSVKLDADWSVGTTGSTYGIATFYAMADDGLGGQMIQPIDLSDRYALVVTGFSGKKIGVYFSQADSKYRTSTSSYAFDYDNTPRTARTLYVNGASESIDLGYNYPSYPTMWLKGVMNYAEFVENQVEESGDTTSFTEYTAPDAGGFAANDSGYVCQIYTAKAWNDADGFANYEVKVEYQDGDDAWLVGTDNLTVDPSSTSGMTTSFINTSYWANYGQQVLGLYAQALPSGKTGRHAFVTLSYNGTTSNKIVVRQGDDKTTVTDGINAVSVVDNAKATDNRTYNLAGQQVNKAYKGVVVRNGKKFIQ